MKKKIKLVFFHPYSDIGGASDQGVTIHAPLTHLIDLKNAIFVWAGNTTVVLLFIHNSFSFVFFDVSGGLIFSSKLLIFDLIILIIKFTLKLAANQCTSSYV